MTTDIRTTDIRSPPAAPIRATVYVSRWPNIPAREFPGVPNGTFSPTTATLVSGATEVVLIDALYLKDDVRDLGDLIERTDKKLTTIYITHDHADHYLGFGAAPGAIPGGEGRGAASRGGVHEAEHAASDRAVAHSVRRHLRHGGAASGAARRRHAVRRRISPAHHRGEAGDTHSASIVHVPEIDVAVAGDSVCNEMHPMLGVSTPDEWQDWLETVDTVERLRPRMIVSGHRRPDGDDYAVETMIALTRAYIQDFAAASKVAKDAEKLVATMVEKYPHHGNVWTLQYSAGQAIAKRDAAE
ncbi:MBL fold metallo-hydrolase [Streptomyces sp. NPDC050759]|uniref:MBL fold metallo-hydrolase n=1 Tax=Streptomyces sp. NPDC050759 TaxID=3365635 RepID=UPI0037B2F069